MTNNPNPDEIPEPLRDPVDRWRRVSAELPAGIADRILSDARYDAVLEEIASLVARASGAVDARDYDAVRDLLKTRVERVALEEATAVASDVLDDLISDVDDDVIDARTLDEILDDAALELSDSVGIDSAETRALNGIEAPALSLEERATLERIETSPSFDPWLRPHGFTAGIDPRVPDVVTGDVPEQREGQ